MNCTQAAKQLLEKAEKTNQDNISLIITKHGVIGGPQVLANEYKIVAKVLKCFDTTPCPQGIIDTFNLHKEYKN